MAAAAQFPGTGASTGGNAPQGQRMSGAQVLQMVGGLLDRGRYREAAGHSQQLLKQAPDAVPALILYGSAMRRIGRTTEARGALEKAIAIIELTPPPAPDPEAGEDARTRWELAVLQPRLRSELAWVRAGEGDGAGALDVLAPAIEAQGDQLYIKSAQAASLLESGKSDEAGEVLRASVASELTGPARAEALRAAARLVSPLASPPSGLGELAEALAMALDQGGLAAERVSEGLRALGDLRHATGAHEEAFAGWRRAANLRRGDLDPSRIAQAYATAASAWTAATMGKLRVTPISEEAPVLVLGPPGTGAARVSALLATHPGIIDAGASEALQQAAGRRFAKDGRPSVEALTRPASLRGKDIAEVGKQYAERIRKRAGGGVGLVLDRQAHNILLVGLAALALPRARVVFVDHDAASSCLDAYAHEDFAETPYADDLRSLGIMRLSYQHLRDHWQRTLDEIEPGRWTSVSVESMLADPAGERGRVSEFLGLDSPGSLDAGEGGGVDAWRRMPITVDAGPYASHLRDLDEVLRSHDAG